MTLYQLQRLFRVEQNDWVIAFGELEWIEEEAVIACFKVSCIPLED
jgi:hypothetical protein